MSSRVIELPYAPGAEPDAALRCGCLGDLGEQVDLWTFFLDAEAAPAGRDAALLSADEAARAARFRRERDRRRFIAGRAGRSEEHTSELPSLMRISYAVFCLNTNSIAHMSIQSSHITIHLHSTGTT